MARTKYLELPEELCNAIEDAASAQGLTTAEWLSNNLTLVTRTSEDQGRTTEKSKEKEEAAREIWLTQL